MPTRDHAPAGAPVWIELTTSDVDRARAFYARVFGWEAGEANSELGGYFSFTLGGAPVAGGMSAQPDSGIADVWSVYLASDDAARTAEAAAGHGAQIVAPAMAVADLGVMAVIVDPAGAGVGIWQPDQHLGFTTLGEPGAPSWFELHTRDFQGALDFYRQVFGWETETMSDTDDFRYSVLSLGGEQLAGVMDDSGNLPEGAQSHWKVYFGAADADACLDDIVAAGGSVLRPAEDTPYGRLAEAADPMGTAFMLVAR